MHTWALSTVTNKAVAERERERRGARRPSAHCTRLIHCSEYPCRLSLCAASEIRAGLAVNNVDVRSEAIDAALCAMDPEGTGRIDLAPFCACMHALSVQSRALRPPAKYAVFPDSAFSIETASPLLVCRRRVWKVHATQALAHMRVSVVCVRMCYHRARAAVVHECRHVRQSARREDVHVAHRRGIGALCVHLRDRTVALLRHNAPSCKLHTPH